MSEVNTLTKIQKDRLTKLANHLKIVPQKLFNLNYIIDVELSNKDYEKEYLEIEAVKEKKLTALKKQEHNCGAVACAIGWCPVVFPRHFKWASDDYVYLKGTENGKYGPVSDFDAASKFFGLTDSQASYLFNPSSYHKSKRGPKSVATRIESLVKNNGVMTQKNYDPWRDVD